MEALKILPFGKLLSRAVFGTQFTEETHAVGHSGQRVTTFSLEPAEVNKVVESTRTDTLVGAFETMFGPDYATVRANSIIVERGLGMSVQVWLIGLGLEKG